jgi:hypothetical protein
MVTAPKISLRAALCSSTKNPNRRTPPRRRTLSTKTPSTPTASAQIAADPCGSSRAFSPLGDATLPRRHFAATRHETGFDDLYNDHVSPKPLVAVAFAGDKAVRPRMGQGRQDPRRRPFRRTRRDSSCVLNDQAPFPATPSDNICQRVKIQSP